MSLFIRIATLNGLQCNSGVDDDTQDGGCDAMKKHAHYVMETLGAAAECLELEDSSVLSNILVALGQIHGTYQVKAHYLPVNLVLG